MKKWLVGSGVALPLALLGAWGDWPLQLRNHHLSFVPEAMEVSEILYVAEDSWGFGPGANETGIIVYPMPEAVAAGLIAEGVAYLEALPRNQRGDWHGTYDNWRDTPIRQDKHWPVIAASEPHICGAISPGIGDYTFPYDVCIPFDRDIERMVNQAIFVPGSYYAHGRAGVLILIPKARRIVYAYNG
jgi:hypothetical protein